MSMSVANILQAVVDMGLGVLVDGSRYVKATNRNYEGPVTQGHNDEVKITIPGVVTTRDIANADNYVSDPTPTTKSVKLTEHRGSSFQMSDFDQNRVMAGIVPAGLQAAAAGITKKVDEFIASKTSGLYLHVGQANVAPFGSGPEEFNDAQALLNGENAPEDRQLILTPMADSALNNTRDFRDKNFSGLSAPHSWSNNVWSNPAVTASGYEVDTAGALAAATTVPLKTGTGDFGVGTVIEFANHEGTYTVESQTSTTSIVVFPALRAAVTNGVDIAVKSGGKQNVLLCRDAIAFAASAMQSVQVPRNADVAYAIDPVSGLALRLEVSRNSKDKITTWDFDSAYGATLVYRNLGVRLSGK